MNQNLRARPSDICPLARPHFIEFPKLHHLLPEPVGDILFQTVPYVSAVGMVDTLSLLRT